MGKMDVKKKQLLLEILRFLIVGGGATIFDFATKTLVAKFLPTVEDGFNSFLHFTIPLICGFIVGVLVNYFLSIIWVFQDVEDKEKSKSKSSFLLFVLLGFIGMLLGLGIFYAFRYGILAATSGTFDIDVGKNTISLTSPQFWAYFGVFCFQTIVVLVYNYITRKKFIFKPKKFEESAEITADPALLDKNADELNNENNHNEEEK